MGDLLEPTIGEKIAFVHGCTTCFGGVPSIVGAVLGAALVTAAAAPSSPPTRALAAAGGALLGVALGAGAAVAYDRLR